MTALGGPYPWVPPEKLQWRPSIILAPGGTLGVAHWVSGGWKINDINFWFHQEIIKDQHFHYPDTSSVLREESTGEPPIKPVLVWLQGMDQNRMQDSSSLWVKWDQIPSIWGIRHEKESNQRESETRIELTIIEKIQEVDVLVLLPSPNRLPALPIPVLGINHHFSETA